MGELGPVGSILVGLLVLIVASGLLASTPVAFAVPFLAFGLLLYAGKMNEFRADMLIAKLRPREIMSFGGVAYWSVFLSCVLVGLVVLASFTTFEIVNMYSEQLMAVGIALAGLGILVSIWRLGKK